jgi:hypothetical protein
MERCLELGAVGRWTQISSRCPVSVAACSEAKRSPGASRTAQSSVTGRTTDSHSVDKPKVNKKGGY